ncbi:MAG TPA: universal stress protein [Ktedonobacteraceae bacterium]|nr:universal stress protein [Ktedonobacteraceae bacterium]
MFKRIIVPLDGSGRAERAIPIAARLARVSGGSIFLVRVVSTEAASLPSVPGRPLLIQTVGETDRALAESYLTGIASSDLLAGIEVHNEVPTGLIAPSILAIASDKQADIVVICSHGYTGVTRWWMMGSVAAKVARYARTPVLVLREGGPVPSERHPGEQPLRVLVPLDGSDDAKAALMPAATLAASLAFPGQGGLHLTHVVRPSATAPKVGRLSDMGRMRQANQNMAWEYLKALISQFGDRIKDAAGANLNLKLTASVTVDDDIAQGIISVAENGDGEGTEMFGGCDVIAMTTHGYGGRQHWVGSVTERVLDTSRMPLLIVQPGA